MEILKIWLIGSFSLFIGLGIITIIFGTKWTELSTHTLTRWFIYWSIGFVGCALWPIILFFSFLIEYFFTERQ